MSDTYTQFEKRLDGLTRKHKELAGGYTVRVGHDGLIIVQPKRFRFGLRAKFLILAVIGFMAFKALAFAFIGPTTYDERVAALAEGTAFEQAGAWVMQSEPVTEKLAEWIGPFVGPLIQ